MKRREFLKSLGMAVALTPMAAEILQGVVFAPDEFQGLASLERCSNIGSTSLSWTDIDRLWDRLEAVPTHPPPVIFLSERAERGWKRAFREMAIEHALGGG